MSYSVAFLLIGELAHANGATPLKDYPGCWEASVGERWWVALNGHAEAVECSRGLKVDPYHAYVEFKGWPAGVINPVGGTIVGFASEDALIAALEAAIQELERPAT